MARTRTTKKLAQRIDLNYFKRPTATKRAKFWLGVGSPALALVWIAWHGLARDSRVYSSGTMSEAHAVLEKECVACHVKTAGTFSAKATDSACLSCHDGPMHHTTNVRSLGTPGLPRCAECHVEHRGRVNLRATSDDNCRRCHGDLKTTLPTTQFATQIRSFGDGHPEFAQLRENPHDPGTIRVNHAMHLKPIRSGPNGPNVQLDCEDCHRTEAASGNGADGWKYSDAKYVGATTSYSQNERIWSAASGILASYRRPTGRELMAPVKFATACAGCHSQAFDKRFSEGVPHDKPEVIRAFLVKNFTEYIGKHAEELRVEREPTRDLSGKPAATSLRVVTPAEWVRIRTAESEDLLWRKTCKQCHTLTHVPALEESARPVRYESAKEVALAVELLPNVEPSNTISRWMPHAKFDHDGHRGFSCVSCHEKALTSTEASDVLLPGIATCKTCHAPGVEHAESRCFECHTYHDWARRKEVKPTFTLPALKAGGR